MGWPSWSRKNSDSFTVSSGTVGLDVNATRLRAMSCETGRPPRSLLLDEPHADLPLAVSLENRHPEVGRAALGLERRLPHLTCFAYLDALTQPLEWKCGRHRFDAKGLLTLAIERVRTVCPKPENLTLALPVYLSPPKVAALANVFEKSKLAVRGSAVLPLALLAASDASEPRPSLTMVVDVDDHALNGAIVACEANQARLIGSAIQPRLSLRIWKDRLLNALADRCVRVCRRDPRDSALAEQALFEQIDSALDRVRSGRKVDLTIRSTHWYQNLIQNADDFDGYCNALAKQSASLLRDLMLSAPEPLQAVWLTHAAGRLPGLANALHEQLTERAGVSVLPADAGARAAVTLATRWERDELPRTHLDSVVLLPESGPQNGRAAAHENVALRSRLET